MVIATDPGTPGKGVHRLFDHHYDNQIAASKQGVDVILVLFIDDDSFGGLVVMLPVIESPVRSQSLNIATPATDVTQLWRRFQRCPPSRIPGQGTKAIPVDRTGLISRECGHRLSEDSEPSLLSTIAMSSARLSSGAFTRPQRFTLRRCGPFGSSQPRLESAGPMDRGR